MMSLLFKATSKFRGTNYLFRFQLSSVNYQAYLHCFCEAFCECLSPKIFLKIFQVQILLSPLCAIVNFCFLSGIFKVSRLSSNDRKLRNAPALSTRREKDQI